MEWLGTLIAIGVGVTLGIPTARFAKRRDWLQTGRRRWIGLALGIYGFAILIAVAVAGARIS